MRNQFSSVQFSCSVVSDSLDLMNCNTPGFPIHHQLREYTQTHVHRVSDAIQASHLLSSPSSPALNLSQHQGLFKWVSSSHQVAKVLEFQLQHQSFQWTMWNNKYQNFLSFNFIASMFTKNKENTFICFVPQIKFWKLCQFNILKMKVKWLRKLWIMLTTNKVVIILCLKTFIMNFVHFRSSAMFIKNYLTFWLLPCHFKNHPCFLPLLTENSFFFFNEALCVHCTIVWIFY